MQPNEVEPFVIDYVDCLSKSGNLTLQGTCKQRYLYGNVAKCYAFSNLDISLLSYDVMPFDELGLL